MGLIHAARAAVSSVTADQWLEYFQSDALPETVLAVRGAKVLRNGAQQHAGSDNIISNGSRIAVADGQCMMIVDQGRILDVCAEPGEFVLTTSSEPSFFDGGRFGENVRASLRKVAERTSFGGQPGRDMRVYYVNTKELTGNKYGTPAPVPFRVVDTNIGLDVDISIRFYGQYSYRIVDPILFYKNVAGNFGAAFTRAQLEGQLKAELLTALQPAIGRVSAMGVRYSALPLHTAELADCLNEALSQKWRELRGIEIVSMAVSSVTANEADEAMIKDLQRTAVMRDPSMAAARLADAQAGALMAAAGNESGAMAGFLGLGMAQGATGGQNVAGLFAMGQQQAAPVGVATVGAAAGWTCTCGTSNDSKFCQSCGSPQPAPADTWTCTCGAASTGRFCAECGSQRPAAARTYRCDKCGFVPPDPTRASKFCPECGDPFNDDDLV